MKENWHVLPDLGEVSRAAADLVVAASKDATRRRERFTIVLSGGSTPRALYQFLAKERAQLIDWAHTHVFFGDERCVPPDHKDSNFAMAHETLLSRVPIPAENVHRMEGEIGPRPGAEAYETMLRDFFGSTAPPPFDLVLLGIGADGHTLSLFPGHDFSADRGRWVVPSRAPAGAPSPDRITLTLEGVAGAERSAFLVAGMDKAAAVKQIKESRSAGDGPPAAHVRCGGYMIWLVDDLAA